MAYNRKNHLLKVIEVQELYSQHKKDCVTHVGVYNEFIKPKYGFSISTLNNYLATPAKADLKKLEAKKAQ